MPILENALLHSFLSTTGNDIFCNLSGIIGCEDVETDPHPERIKSLCGNLLTSGRLIALTFSFKTKGVSNLSNAMS